jgi:hypothetical protein
MGRMVFSAVLVIVVGAGMLLQWGLLLLAGRIPERKTEPARIAFHIAAEALTALVLIVSGVGLLLSADWAKTVFYLSSGMLLYTAIASPGYFVHQGRGRWAILFAVLIVLIAVAVGMVSHAAL